MSNFFFFLPSRVTAKTDTLLAGTFLAPGLNVHHMAQCEDVKVLDKYLTSHMPKTQTI
jgi:hypothetical protein